MAVADCRVEGVAIGVVHLLADFVENGRSEDLLHWEALASQRGGEVFAPAGDRVLASLADVPLSDLRTGLAAHHELEPVLARRSALGLRGEDLDGVTGLELRLERHEAAVHPRADARVADFGVDGVGEIDRSGVDGQGDDLALRREHEHLVVFEVDLQRGHELGGIVGVVLPVDDSSQPREVIAL